MKFNKARYLLLVGCALSILTYFVQGREEGRFQGNILAEAAQQSDVRIELRGVLEQSGLDHITVQDTLQRHWKAFHPESLHAGMQWGLQYAESLDPEMNFLLWSRVRFDNRLAHRQWLENLVTSDLVEVEWEISGTGMSGFISGQLPVPDRPGEFISLDRVAFRAAVG